MRNDLRILIVDDEESIRNLLGDFISEHYPDVLLAENALKATEKLQEYPVDVILTDLVMPEMTGRDLLKVVQERYPNTIVIVMTGHASVESAVDAMRLGAFDYLVKPFNLSEAEITIERAGELLRLRKENARLIEDL
ncbi:MAG TPA: response regulator, partial [bacterium]|nr:response regulator [bacterium]